MSSTELTDTSHETVAVTPPATRLRMVPLLEVRQSVSERLRIGVYVVSLLVAAAL